MDYNVSAKVKGKWWTFGKINKNKFDNYQLGMKKTKELVEFINSVESGKYINFALFEPKGDVAEPKFNDEIPF